MYKFISRGHISSVAHLHLLCANLNYRSRIQIKNLYGKLKAVRKMPN